MTKLGHHLREWREYRGLTQVQLAPIIGISRSYLSKLETGDQDYLQYIIERIAIALRCEVSDLVGVRPRDANFYTGMHEEAAKFDYENQRPILFPEKRGVKKRPPPDPEEK